MATSKEAYDEGLKPYAAEAENLLDRFFQSGAREDCLAFFEVLDELKESARQDCLTDRLKGLVAGAALAKKVSNA